LPDVRPTAVVAPPETESEEREQRALFEALKKATLGDYDIYSPLGRGGMATVFLALELSLNRPVAIKVISPSALTSTTIIDRFWLEARTAASLSHPNVIPIYAVKSVAGLHFFVMKHVQGGSLDTVLSNEGPLSFSLTRTILMQVSSALAYAHRRGVVHRDIKPANIMLDDDGYAVVMDFGIAKVRDVAALTASGAMVGTPYYMSPEQFSGGDVTGSSDQYSLGVVAFELLAGVRPFRGNSVPEVLRGHLMDKPPDLRSIRPECPTALATLINRMLCKEATDRFPSMEAVCAQLDSMPRMDADKVREKIVSMARTASMSSPQINEPRSPSPPSRTSSGDISAAPQASTVRRRVVMRLQDLAHSYRGVMTVTAAAAIAAVIAVAAMKQWDSNAVMPNPLAKTAMNPVTSTASLSLVQPLQTAIDTTHVHVDSTIALRTPSKIATKDEKPLKRVPAQSESRTFKEAARPSVTEPLVEPSTSPVEEPVVLPPPVQPSTIFRVGSRLSGATLYIDGELIGLMRGGIKDYRHVPGRVHIQIRADDCMSFDTVVALPEGVSTTIGWRQPKCSR
jgi:serine/threonine protein kinase